MMQEKHTIDFRSRRAGCTQARPSDGFFPQFYLDFFSVVGKPGRLISRHGGLIFDNITVSFQRWSALYGAKHVSGIPFDVTGRTFRIAQASTRETWFIVMHPAGEKSGMPMPLACELASYITGVFQSPALLGEGIQRSWRPGGQESQRISSNRWMAFQEAFMEGWAAWSGRHSGATSFWARHEPAFHAYNYGANIEIEVSEELYDLPRERHCAMDDSEDEEDGEETGGGRVDDDDDDEMLQLEELSVADDGPRRAEVEGVAGAHGCTRSSRGGIDHARRRLHEGGGNPGRPITMENIASCETTMAAWEAAPDAFTWKALQQLCRGLRLGGERVAIAVSKQRTRHDFVAELLRVISSEKGRDSFAAKNATWPLTLHFAIINSRKSADGINIEIWVAVVTGCFLAASIEWVPNSVRGRLTSRSVVRLGGQATVQPAPFGPPGSLRRAAREAEIKHERTVKDWVQR
ncbi:hypothetical protein RB213_003213 [Colletotrichum asianum]